MTNYHVNPKTGDPSKCSTTPDKCPFGNKFPGFEIYHLKAKNLAEAKSKAEEYNRLKYESPERIIKSEIDKSSTNRFANTDLNKFAETDETVADVLERRKKLTALAKKSKDEETLYILAHDKDVNVQTAVAQNPAAPSEAMQAISLLTDENLESIWSNPKTPIEVKEEILMKAESQEKTEFGVTRLRQDFAGRIVSPELISKYAESDDPYLLSKLAENPNISKEIQIKLASFEEKNPDDEAPVSAGMLADRLANNPKICREAITILNEKNQSEFEDTVPGWPFKNVPFNKVDPLLKLNIAKHPNVSDDVLKDIYKEAKTRTEFYAQKPPAQVIETLEGVSFFFQQHYTDNWKKVKEYVEPRLSMKTMLELAMENHSDEEDE